MSNAIMLEMSPLLQTGETSSSSCLSVQDYGRGRQVLEACLIGDYLSLHEVLENRGNPNECDSKGKTGMHVAAARGRDDILQLLLEKGADLQTIDCYGNTPLHYCGHPETINYLVANGASINYRNKNGDDPLTLMKRRGIENGSVELMEKLSESVSLNSTDESQQPLISNSIHHSSRNRKYTIFAIQELWFEFCKDIGAEKLVFVLLLVLCLSVYVAYLATEVAKSIDTRIPIDEEVKKMEL